jgi:acetolactate synthase-1/2/3 large subunit
MRRAYPPRSTNAEVRPTSPPVTWYAVYQRFPVELAAMEEVAAVVETVAAAAVRWLAGAGARRAYTVPGESFLGLLDAVAAHPDLTLVSTRHESGAAFMAAAEAQLTGVPAIAMASRGPGATNLSIGVHTAHQDRTPVLVLLGQVSSRDRHRHALQEMDLAAFYTPITVSATEARHPTDLPHLITTAWHAATTGRRGPAAVIAPTDFWDTPITWNVPSIDLNQETTDPDAVDRIAGLVASARRPVIIAGTPARWHHAELVALADRLGLGVYTAFRRQDAFPEDHPRYLGHLGLGTPDHVLTALADADLILVLDSRFDAVTSESFRFPLPHQHLVLVGPAPQLPVGAPGPVTTLDTDLLPFLDALGRLPPIDRPVPVHPPSTFEKVAPGPGFVDAGEVITTLRRLAPADTVITTDAGNFAAFVHRYWRFSHARTLLGTANGSMGYGVPAAVAAKLAEPHRTVVATVGDGGIMMTGQEIETAVRHRAPIIVLAFQNNLYGTIAMHQAREHRPLSAVGIGPLDLAAWARALGAAGRTLTDPADIEPALTEALTSDIPYVMDIHTDPARLTPDTRLPDIPTGQ